MNRDQEYIKFWAEIVNKMNEVQEDYNKLSPENKQRVDNVKKEIFRANTVLDVMSIINQQI